MHKGLRAYVAEFIGTFLFLFAGMSAVVGHTLVNFGPAANVAIPLAFGIGLMVAVFALGHLSGAHLNPAVTLAFAVTRKNFAWSDVPGYLAAQLLAGVAVAAVHAYAFGAAGGFAQATTMPGQVGGAPIAVGVVGLFEFIATFGLMFVITAVATDTRIQGVPAGFAIGFTVAAMALGAGWVSGGSFNPARSFGPALLAGDLSFQWVYWVFPIAGAIAAVYAYDFVRGSEPTPEQPPVMRDPTIG